MAWIFFRASEALPWPSLHGCAPSPTARSTSLLVACSCRGWPTLDCAKHQFGTTLPLFALSTLRANASTSSPPASPAKTSHSPDLEQAWLASAAGFIAKSCALSATFDRGLCSWKTLPQSESTLMPLSKIWPRSGMTAGGQLLKLPDLVPRIAATAGGSLLPTPTASTYGSSQNGSNSNRPSAGTLSLGTRVARGMLLLPTPTASDRKRAGGKAGHTKKRQGGPHLAEAVLWPTPTTADKRATARGTTTAEASHAGTTLTDALRSHTGKPGDLLSPRFVEWMMGYPITWTRLEHWATPLCPSLPE